MFELTEHHLSHRVLDVVLVDRRRKASERRPDGSARARTSFSASSVPEPRSMACTTMMATGSARIAAVQGEAAR